MACFYVEVYVYTFSQTPAILMLTFFICLMQNVGGGTSVLRVVATDRDIGPNAVLSYYITDGNQDLTFRMDRLSGEIVTRPSPPDRERQQQYTLAVTVEDDGTPPISVSVSVCRGYREKVIAHFVFSYT